MKWQGADKYTMSGGSPDPWEAIMNEEATMKEQWYDKWLGKIIYRAYWKVRRFGLRRLVKEGEMIPSGFGVAYRDWLNHWAVAYPIPLNLLVRAGRAIWHKLKSPRWLRLMTDRIYKKGLRVETSQGHPAMTKVYLDGREIGQQLRAVTLRIGVDAVASAKLEYVGGMHTSDVAWKHEEPGQAGRSTYEKAYEEGKSAGYSEAIAMMDEQIRAIVMELMPLELD
jgi:hypothetical protein